MGPPLVYNGIEAYYPGTLSLEQVQILFRHGERTPVHRSIQQWSKWGFPIFWPLCASSQSTRTLAVDPDLSHVFTMGYEREIETLTEEDPSPLFTNAGKKGVCLEGQLTDKGRISANQLGKQIRELYIDRLAFLPSFYNVPSDIYMRTTSIQRSRETLLQLITGLYPGPSLQTLPKILERFPFEENLYPMAGNCARIRELRKQFVEASAKYWDPKLEEPSEVFKQILSGSDKKIAVGGGGETDSAWAIIDTYASAVSHNITTPAAFENRDAVNLVGRAALDSEFIGFDKNQEMKRLGMGRFLGEVLHRMTVGDPIIAGNKEEATKLLGKEFKTANKIPLLALYAAHDSSIGALLATMGVFDNRWINFTTHITFELFKEKVESNKWLAGKPSQFVRVKYNGKPMSLPACQAAGQHYGEDKSLCTMAAFKSFVNSVAPHNWGSECTTNLGKSAPELGEVEHRI
ncbi:histidine phosphatase superfamily [Lipomyces arxii]|uniref:histidine phosphatase superfamily n=1 Tax=Lipomyces arxii TaxID=56418 RepID=UPI0034CE6D37